MPLQARLGTMSNGRAWYDRAWIAGLVILFTQVALRAPAPFAAESFFVEPHAAAVQSFFPARVLVLGDPVADEATYFRIVRYQPLSRAREGHVHSSASIAEIMPVDLLQQALHFYVSPHYPSRCLRFNDFEEDVCRLPY